MVGTQQTNQRKQFAKFAMLIFPLRNIMKDPRLNCDSFTPEHGETPPVNNAALAAAVSPPVESGTIAVQQRVHSPRKLSVGMVLLVQFHPTCCACTALISEGVESPSPRHRREGAAPPLFPWSMYNRDKTAP